MSLDDLIARLRCPVCGADLTYEPVAQASDLVGTCGLLRCPCFVYPVLDGVPILMQDRLDHRSIADDRVIVSGPCPTEVAALVAQGEGLRALVDVLSPPVCPWPLNRVGALRRLSGRGPHAEVGLSLRKRWVHKMLARRRDLTAEDWLAALYWHAPVPFDPFNYFFFRFGQPRYLATLGLLSVLPPEGALLDVACGYGHVLHAHTAGGGTGVGLDQNVHQAWVARHYVAPEAGFVCADADRPLPFRDGAFASALCSDVFHFLRHKAACVGELDRCTGGGPILLASAGNRLVGPAEGDELSPDEYAALLADRHVRIRTHADLVDRYLAGLGPDLSASAPGPEADRAPWLYVAAAHDAALLCDHGPLGEWPHAAGRLRVNPIYERHGDRLVFRFPSPWYAEENHEMEDYMPASVSLADVPRGELLARCVLIGLPERYVRAAGRPRTLAANRAAGAFVIRLRRRRAPA